MPGQHMLSDDGGSRVGDGHDHHELSSNNQRPQHHTTNGATKRTSVGASSSDVAHRAAITAASSATSSAPQAFQSPIPPAGTSGGGISRLWMSSPSPPVVPSQQHQALSQQSYNNNSTSAATINLKTPRRQLDFQNNTNGSNHHRRSSSIDDSEEQASGEPTSSSGTSSFSSFFMSSTAAKAKAKTKTTTTTLRRSGSSSMKENNSSNSSCPVSSSKGRGMFGSCCGGGGHYSFGSVLMIMMVCSCCSYILMVAKLVGNATTIMDVAQQIDMTAATFGGDEPAIPSSKPPRQEKPKPTTTKPISVPKDQKQKKDSKTGDVKKVSKSMSKATLTAAPTSKDRTSETKTSTATTTSKLRPSTSKTKQMTERKSQKDEGATSSTKPTSSSSTSSQLRHSTKTKATANKDIIKNTKAKEDKLETKKTAKNPKTKGSGTSSASTTTTRNGSSSSSSSVADNLQNKTLVTTAKSIKSSAGETNANVRTGHSSSVATAAVDRANITDNSASKLSLFPSTTKKSSKPTISDSDSDAGANRKDTPSPSLPTPYTARPRVAGLIVTYHTNTNNQTDDHRVDGRAAGPASSVVAAVVGSILDSTADISTRKDNGRYSVQYLRDLTDTIFLQSRRKRISDVQRTIIWQQQQATAAKSIGTNSTTALSSSTVQSMDVDLFELPPLLGDEEEYNEIVTPVSDASSENQTDPMQLNDNGRSNATKTVDSLRTEAANEWGDASTADDEETCQPMADWMTSSFVNCNTIHEIDMPSGSMRQEGTDVQFLGQGWFRSAWRYSSTSAEVPIDNGTPPPPLILKTLRIEREFLDEYFELHRRDAVAMERLTSSPFVMDVYGYCGQSALNEFAEGILDGQVSSLEQLNRRMRGRESDEKTLKLKLQLATSVALGLAHVHNVNVGTTSRIPSAKELLYDIPNNGNATTTGFPKSMATMAHYDINPRNIAIMKDGRPKLNDFNIAEFLQYRLSKNDDGTEDVQTCGFRSRLHEPWWRAPEEMNTNLTEVVMIREKVDVYALGNVLYHILTTHSPRGKMKKERMDEVRTLVQAGVAPALTEPFASDPGLRRHRVVKAIVKAMDLCFAMDPNERGSSIDVARVLHQALQREKERDVQAHLKQRDAAPDTTKADKSSLKKQKAKKEKNPLSKKKKKKPTK